MPFRRGEFLEVARELIKATEEVEAADISHQRKNKLCDAINSIVSKSVIEDSYELVFGEYESDD